ncbi:MAG: diaminopimelate epimerase [Pseudomonadales bacterium]
MSTLKFTKMHGIGNDFMVLDLVTQSWDPEPERIARWGDRRTGVGFDQLLIVAPPTDPEADFWYRIYNSDGSEAEQCGNGARCVARFIHQNCLSPKATLNFQSNSGPMRTTLKEGSQVEVDMGLPVLDLDSVPFDATGLERNERGEYQLACAEQVFALTPVSLGNPHGVLFIDNIGEAPVAEFGPLLTAHSAFPAQANIGFCQVVDESFLRLRVHERGAGETRACGSGACAAMVAARLLGLVSDRVKVSLPGGKVKIAWDGVGTPVTMSGPAARVFDGEISL